MLVATRIALTLQQGLSLRQHIGQQQRLVALEVMARLLHGDELHGHHISPLVQHLKVGMLAIGSGLAPQHGRGAKRKRFAGGIDTLAIALHLQLLQVGRNAAQGAVVRGNAAAGEAVEVAVPDVQQTQAHWQIVFQRRGAEVLVHGVCTGQKFTETGCANSDGNGQANGRPHGIATTHPVPESKGGGDAKRVCRGHVGGQCSKVARNVGTSMRLEPGLGRGGVGHGLDGGEGLAGNQKDSAIRLEVGQLGGQLVAIHIAHKVQTLAGGGKRVQRQHRHLRPQIGTANADVHHVGDGLVCTHFLGVGQHSV